jgi:hypothetical protein
MQLHHETRAFGRQTICIAAKKSPQNRHDPRPALTNSARTGRVIENSQTNFQHQLTRRPKKPQNYILSANL